LPNLRPSKSKSQFQTPSLIAEIDGDGAESPLSTCVPDAGEAGRSGHDGASHERRILRSLRQINHCVDLYSRQLVISHQITAPQLVCLLAVVQQGPLTATSISREIHLSASTVVGILDRLEEKGWVSRARDCEDRRVVRVSATKKGIALSHQVPSPLQKTLANALSTLPEPEQATIALSLERIVALMAEHAKDAPLAVTAGPLINPDAP
jgi:DNA-binding MarR family transcriptional regulator